MFYLKQGLFFYEVALLTIYFILLISPKYKNKIIEKVSLTKFIKFLYLTGYTSFLILLLDHSLNKPFVYTLLGLLFFPFAFFIYKLNEIKEVVDFENGDRIYLFGFYNDCKELLDFKGDLISFNKFLLNKNLDYFDTRLKYSKKVTEDKFFYRPILELVNLIPKSKEKAYLNFKNSEERYNYRINKYFKFGENKQVYIKKDVISKSKKVRKKVGSYKFDYQKIEKSYDSNLVE